MYNYTKTDPIHRTNLLYLKVILAVIEKAKLSCEKSTSEFEN